MEREYEAADEGVIELGLATEITHGQGSQDLDYPQGQTALGSLED
ncbi:hypothetical protein [Novosphingobium sp. TCA1]|nr:hypothetical protein [Novosphingobium sp. TCA1]GFE77862.1 hypothetical protein NTCA1_55110 [Novosphingobium sp. TCA1]